MSALVDSYNEHISKLKAGTRGAQIRTKHGWCSAYSASIVKQRIHEMEMAVVRLENR